jgi:hypothetical protein
MPATCHTHLSLLDLITIVTFDEEICAEFILIICYLIPEILNVAANTLNILS